MINHKEPFSKRLYRFKIFKYYQIYLILIPALLYFLIFNYLPMYGLTLAFKDYQFDKGMFFSPWVGFKYFEAFFNYYNIWVLIRNTLVISFFKIVIYFPFPIVFALMLNEIRFKRFKSFIQTASYLPHFISWVVAVIIFQQFLSLDGFINQIRISFGLEKIFFMSDARYFYPIMFISYVWKNIGIGSIIYLSAIAGIDQGMYEAAEIDGCGRLKKIWHITLPEIAPTAIVLFIISLAQILNAGWDQIFLLRNPGNMQVADILDTYIISQGLQGGQFGYATAANLIQSVIGLILIIFANGISKKVSKTSLF